MLYFKLPQWVKEISKISLEESIPELTEEYGLEI